MRYSFDLVIGTRPIWEGVFSTNNSNIFSMVSGTIITVFIHSIRKNKISNKKYQNTFMTG